jgi:glycosyltransferase involved in cell wall biosynthesis
MLAIVIPYYKRTFFEATLESLANQTDQRFTVYIGDDASTENPAAFLEKFKGTFNFVYKRFDNNLGGTSLTQHWKRCIALSGSEEWIMILGDDDVLSKNFVESFYSKKKLFQDIYNVVRFSVIKIDKNSISISGKIDNREVEFANKILFNSKRSSLSEYVFRSSTVNKVGFKSFPFAWWSDVLAVLEFSNFDKIYSINDSYVKVRISAESISGSLNFEKQKETASFLFYNYLLLTKIKFFNTIEIDFLLNKISTLYLNNRRNINLFLKISFVYFKNYKFKSYSKFIIMVIKSMSN